METELANNLIALAAAYGAARKLETATVGRMCAADGRFFLRITEGKTFTVKKYDEVVAWFSDNWPADTLWPSDIARPDSEFPQDADRVSTAGAAASDRTAAPAFSGSAP